MCERTVTVKCEGQHKRMQLTLQSFDDIKETIRKQLNLDTEEMSIKAILDGDEDEYDITDDGDLKDSWQELKELRMIINQSERLKKMTFEIDGVHYRIDGPMAADSPIVRKYIDESLLSEFVDQTKAMTAAIELSHLASVAIGNRKLINEMNDICFSTRRICGNTRVLMSGYERTCSRVIEAFQRAIMYMNEINRKSALASFAAVGEYVHQCCEDTRKLIGDIDKTLEHMGEFGSKIYRDRYEMQEKLKDVKKEINKSEDDLELVEEKITNIEKTIDENSRQEGQRKIQSADAGKRGSVASKVYGVGVVGSSAAAGAGLEVVEGVAVAGTVGTVGAVGALIAAPIAAPIFLLVGLGGGIALGAYKIHQTKIEKERQKNHEQIQMKRSEKINEEQKQEKLKSRRNELNLEIKPTENLCDALHQAQRYINCMRTECQQQLHGWKDMELFCESLAKNETMQHYVEEEENCSKILERQGFRVQVVRYYARWVAFKAFARQCNESIKTAQKQLDENLQQAAEGKDVLYLMAPEQFKDRNNKTK